MRPSSSPAAAEPAHPSGQAASHPIHLFVPLFRVDECLQQVRECLERGWTGLGYKTLEFEAAWSTYTGLPHAHFLSSATAGLHLAVRLLKDAEGWEDGDEVITTPFTFVSTNHVLLHERLRPMFADIDEHLCLDPTSVKRLIGPRTRAVVFVGIGGNIGRYEEVVELCRAKGLRLILDAAHMAGTKLHDRHVGSEADACVFSFHAVKNLPTADAGMICFREAALDRQARKWSWLGIDQDTFSRTMSERKYRWKYDVEHAGFKYHGNSVMASLGLTGLKYLDADNAYRRELAAVYDGALRGLRGVDLIPVAPDCITSRHFYQILVERRDELMVHLNGKNIFPGVHYMDNTVYRMYAASAGTCPNARRASDRVISLPLHLRLTPDDIRRVAAEVRSFSAGADR